MQGRFACEFFENSRQVVRLGQTISDEQNRNSRCSDLRGERKENDQNDAARPRHVPRLAAQPVPVFYFLRFNFLPHSGITVPFDLGHLAGSDIDIERSIATDSFLLVLLGDGIMTRRQ